MGLAGQLWKLPELIPIQTSLMRVNTEKFEDIESLMNRMIEAENLSIVLLG